MKYQLGVNLVRLLLAWLSLVARDSKLVVVVLEAIGCVDCHLGSVGDVGTLKALRQMRQVKRSRVRISAPVTSHDVGFVDRMGEEASESLEGRLNPTEGVVKKQSSTFLILGPPQRFLNKYFWHKKHLMKIQAARTEHRT